MQKRYTTLEGIEIGDIKTVNGIEQSYVIDGTGIPYIVIGDARVYRNVFSLELKKYFKLIFKPITGSSDADLENYTKE